MNPPKAKKHAELKPEDLRWKCDPDIFEFSSTSDIEPIEGIRKSQFIWETKNIMKARKF